MSAVSVCESSMSRAQERSAAHLVREIKLNMRGASLHGGQDLRRWGACDGMDLLDLVHLICAREQWE